jgi:hypothetical protein
MSRVEKAIESGKCVVAVGAALLRDPEVMFALRARQGLQPMALSGPAVAHVAQTVTADALGPALSNAGGIVVLVEPESADAAGVKAIGEILQRSRQKPELVIVARAYNPFAFGSALGGLRVQHEKNKGKPFLQALPEVAPAVAPAPVDGAPSEKKQKPLAPGEIAAPRFCFVGRDEEVDALAALLGAGGPIVVHGPTGVGRTQVVEHAVKKAGLQRLPDVWLGWGMGHDTLASRLAAIGKEFGDARLHDVLAGRHTAMDVNRAALEVLNNPALAGKVLVVRELEQGMGRDQDFFRRSRLELLLLAMLTGTAALPIVFVSTRVPTFHREGESANLRKLEIGGVKGRFLHEIFDANKAIEFPRDKFGPISERIHGHAFAAKTFAIATRIRQDGLAAVDDPKFFRMETVADTGPIDKQIERRLEKLPEELRRVLSRLAHLRIPVDGGTLSNELVDEALAAAPVPELFHEAVGFHLARNARNKAIKVLETAVETFPDREPAAHAPRGAAAARGPSPRGDRPPASRRWTSTRCCPTPTACWAWPAARRAPSGSTRPRPCCARPSACALGHVLEARDQFIPAHAEYLRAKERAAQNSLEAKFYDQQLLRVQAIIEAQAAGLWTRPAPEETPGRALQPSPPSQRVLRRRRGDEAEPAVGESVAGESVAGESGAGESVAVESVAVESGAGESGAGESGAGESGAGESAADPDGTN